MMAVRGVSPAREVVIAIMAKRPDVGRTKTRLTPPLAPQEAVELYEALLRDTIRLVASVEVAQLAIAVTPAEAVGEFRSMAPDAVLVPVEGSDIGECLSQTLSGLLAEGYPAAIALNSDGPSLPQAYLRRAVGLVQEADVVIGPSADGGYYLIGMKRPHPELFRGVAWSTDRVTAQTLERAASLGLRVAQLPPWYDVDTIADLVCILHELEDLPADALPHTRLLPWIERYRQPGAAAERALPPAEHRDGEL